jgi:hypothetical protein
MNQISRICPVTDAEAERLVRPGTLADLGARITAHPAGVADGPARARRPGRQPRGRRWPIGTPLAAALAVIGLVAAALAVAQLSGSAPKPATAPRPSVKASTRPLPAQVLSFTASGGYITVIVRNPLADPGRYRAEFAAHHLNITLRLVPVSPSIVGTVVFIDEPAGSPGIATITAQGRCYTGGGGSACPVGVRIPAGFRGQAEVVFGRAARLGEQYESTAPATAPGEAMHGLRFAGDTVAEVLAMLRQRHVAVPLFNYVHQGVARNVGNVPGTWYVYGAVPWAPGQVMLFVGSTRTPPASQAPQPGTPVPSPSS